MQHLSLSEQNCQLFWFQQLKLIWYYRPEFDSYCSSPAWCEFSARMDDTLEIAQTRWDEKFGQKSYLLQAFDTVRNIYSPKKRKANDEAGASSKRLKTESKSV